MLEARQLEPYIYHIRFPRFKNLQEDLRIEFSHPVTALVGPNGTNKTAILRALQGCPEGNNLGQYWFGTSVDKISKEERHRFIYGRYAPTVDAVVEVIKARIARKHSDPDLFEPSRPLTEHPDNMDEFPRIAKATKDASTTRWRNIKKQVHFINSASLVSAFDWYFNFAVLPQTKNGQSSRRRKESLGKRAARLSEAITLKKYSGTYYGKEKIISPIRVIDDPSKDWIERILGRKYDSIEIITHKYFGDWGASTVLLRSSDLSYSEAFAGSGEFIAVMLVDKVMRAKEKSLILLDEPERSLHPSAQQNFVEFLIHAAKTRRHQIVFATHSPDMLHSLPDDAIKVLRLDPANQVVSILSQASSALTAFKSIGAKFDRPTIFVEDKLAKEVVHTAMRDADSHDTFDVKCIERGAQYMWCQLLPQWAQEGRENVLLLLDGDQKCATPDDPVNIPEAKLEETLTSGLNNNRVKAPIPGNQQDKINSWMKELIKWRRSYVDFLPETTPEESLWRLSMEGEHADYKQQWAEYVASEMGCQASAEEILTLQKQALNKLYNSEPRPDYFSQIQSTIENFLKGC